MQSDPVHLNFYQGTGGYAWQLAEFMQRRADAEPRRVRLARPTPPTLHDPLAPYPSRLSPSGIVRWSPAVVITHDMPGLLGRRGSRCSFVVCTDNAVFGQFDRRSTEALSAGVPASDIDAITLNGRIYDGRRLLVSMMRHGLVSNGELIADLRPTSVVREPTCSIVPTTSYGWVAINDLNGRVIRLTETSRQVLEHAEAPQPVESFGDKTFRKFFEAGMLRMQDESRSHEAH